MAIPTKDSVLVQWAANADEKLTASPSTWGYTAPQAVAFNVVAQGFIDAYNAMMQAREDGTFSESLTALKESAKANFLNVARPLYLAVQASRTISDADKILLGVHVPDAEPSPVPPPQISPDLLVKPIGPHALSVQILDPLEPTSKRRPNGVQGTAIFTCTGEAPLPVGDAGWVWQGQTTRMKGNTITVSSSLPGGTKVWVCAVFYNAKGEHGPVSTAVSAYLPMTDAQPIAA